MLEVLTHVVPNRVSGTVELVCVPLIHAVRVDRMISFALSALGEDRYRIVAVGVFSFRSIVWIAKLLSGD